MSNYLRKQLRERGFILTHDFRGFIPWSSDSIAMRQDHTCLPHGSQEAERVTERGCGQVYLFI
jgi:hypothetical protein